MSKFTYIASRYIVPAGAKTGSGLRLVFDIETDGLLSDATRIHCIVIGDLDSDQVDAYGPEQVSAALEHLAHADTLTGHNICGYDLPLLHRLHDWQPSPECRIIDTLIAARLILPHLRSLDDKAAGMGDQKLRKLRGRHSLEAWGLRLGIAKTGTDIEDWSQWTSQMEERCISDVAICKALYRFLQIDGCSQQALKLEHRAAAVCGRVSANGVLFDVTAAKRLGDRWERQRAEHAATLCTQFPELEKLTRPRLIALLLERGWTPDGLTEKGKPSLKNNTLENIATAYPEFAGAAEYFALTWLLGNMLRGKSAWARCVQADGRIHAGLIHLGQPHSRASCLTPNLHGVPNPKKGAKFGIECRTLFCAPDGLVMVAADLTTFQDRALAHYLVEFDGGALVQRYLSGEDMHWSTAGALELVDAARDDENYAHTVLRQGAKRFRYAFLFGAQAALLGRIILETARAADPNLLPRLFGSNAPSKAKIKHAGEQALERFMNATPGLRELRGKIAAQVSQGWIPGLDDRRVPLLAQHSSLNFLLVAAEAVVTKRWLVEVSDELDARFGDAAHIAMWVHDEIVVCCRPEIAEQVGELLVRHAKAAGEHFGLKVPVDADYKVGRNWAGEPIKDAAPAEAAAIVLASTDAASIVPAPIEMPETMDSSDDADVTGDDDIVVEAPILELENAVQSVQAFITAATSGRLEMSAQSDVLPPWEGPTTFDASLTKTHAPPEPSLRGGNGHAPDGFDDFPKASPGGKILCPFHDDHSPSLHIYPDGDDPHYHCFVCGAHGRLDDLEVDWETALASPTGKPANDADDERNLERAHELWDKATPIAGTLAERYLAETRGIDVSALPANIDEALRFHPRCPFGQGKRHPCLLALFRDIESGERAGIHRIALTAEAQKIDRRMFGRWPRPRAIKLWPADDKLYVGEGIETVLAAATRLRMRPAWAMATSGYLGELPIISGISELGILVDRDAHGEAAAAACHETWKTAGRRVRRLQTKDAALNDFNDLILAKLRLRSVS
jgi:DNA polymerase I-like protein with 3'-5' exonuclease and polymerase domains